MADTLIACSIPVLVLTIPVLVRRCLVIAIALFPDVPIAVSRVSLDWLLVKTEDMGRLVYLGRHHRKLMNDRSDVAPEVLFAEDVAVSRTPASL